MTRSDKDRPIVSVIVATYNGAQFIEAALRSALRQTLTALEVIVADDGSTDNSTQLVSALAARDVRLRLLPPAPNRGPAAARNRCLAAARGDWIAVLDSDDLMHPQRLARLIASAECDGADIVADDLLVFDQDASVAPHACLRGRDARAARWIELAEYIEANTMFRRRAALGYLKPVIRGAVLREHASRYDETLRIGEDYDLIAGLLLARAKFRLYPELGYFYRRHGRSISHRLASSDVHAMLDANARLFARAAAQPDVCRALAGRAAMLHRALAFDALVLGLKQRRWRDAAAIALRAPAAALLLRQPLAAALARWGRRPAAAAAPRGPQAVVISRQRMVGAVSGSSRYLLDLVGTIAAAGLTPHLVCPTPTIFGRSPVLALRPEMQIFATVAVRGGVRLGRFLIATDPRIWLRAAVGVAGVLLGRMGAHVAALNRPAPYSVATKWTRRDQLFVARRARRRGDLVLADYAFATPGIAYALRPDAPSLVVMHDLFSSRAAQFDRIDAADSVARLDLEQELALLDLADAVIAIQPDEAAAVRAGLPERTVLVAAMAVRAVAAPQPGTTSDVLFVGTKAAPNVIGLRRFLDEAWPIVRHAVPQARLVVCGQVGAAVGALPAGVSAPGFVADLAPLYARAAVVVMPLPAGSGLKVKLVEAFGHGKAIVASACALQGVPPAVAAAVWRADGADATAQAVIGLLRDDALRGRYAAAAHEVARACYGVKTCHEQLRDFLRQRFGTGAPGGSAPRRVGTIVTGPSQPAPLGMGAIRLNTRRGDQAMNDVDPDDLPDQGQSDTDTARGAAAGRDARRLKPQRAGAGEPVAGDMPPGRALVEDRSYRARRAALRRADEARRHDMRLPIAEPGVPNPQAADAAFAWLPYLIFFVRRRWPIMAAMTAVCGGLALIFALTSTPQFTATTQLLVDIRRADLLSQQHEVEDSQTLNSELESRVEILRSEGLARQVVERLGLQHPQPGNAATPNLTDRLRDALSPRGVGHSADPATDKATLQLMRMTTVRRIGLTYVIEIGVTSPSAVRSAQLANALVDTYITGQLSAQDQVTSQAGQWLQQRLAELRDEAMAAGNAVERYKADKNIIGTDKGLLNEQQLTALNAQLVTAMQRSSTAKTTADRARQMLTGNVNSAGMNSDLQSTVINTLRSQYLDDQQRAARWASTYGGRNAQVVKLRAEMSQIELAIRSELQRVAAAAQNEYDAAHADEAALRARLSSIVDQTVKTNSDRVQLSSLQSSANTYRSMYENFLNRYTQAVQDESFPVSEARVITSARPPLRKSAPHTSVLLALGILLGLAGGFVVALAMELLDRRLRTDRQLQAETGLSCIGHLPLLASPSGPQHAAMSASTELRIMPAAPSILRSVSHAPHGDFVQVLRALRARLLRAGGVGDDIRLIGFAPSRRGDGGTTVAVNFAQLLAASGFDTVLVDLDTEDDTLSRAMAPDATAGVLEALADHDLLYGLIRRDDPSGVDVLPLGGRRSASPLSYGAGAARGVFEMLMSSYDYVVVDLPPLTPAVEAHALGNVLDGIILVVDWDRVQRGQLADSMHATGLDPAKFIGALFNRVDDKKMRSYASAESALPAFG